jgi:hypothetical protein
MKQRAITQHTLRCPLYDCTARVTVRTDFNGCPSRRHSDVLSCSLLPSMAFVPPAANAYFPDMEPPEPYTHKIYPTPLHSTELACPKRCLPVVECRRMWCRRTCTLHLRSC